MDKGSTITLIDAELARKIGVKGVRQPLELTCIGELGMKYNDSQLVNFGVSGLDSTVVHKISNARTIKNLNLCCQTVRKEDIQNYTHLSYLPIEFYENAKPHLLIGQDHWDLITAIQTRHTTRDEPAASLTQLGWVVHGRISAENIKKNKGKIFTINHCTEENSKLINDLELSTLVKNSFAIDSIGITTSKKNKQEERAEHILATTAIHKEDHWEVGHLWKNDIVTMPNNRNYALSRLMSLEKKMDNNYEYGKQYCSQVDHLIKCNYAKKISRPTTSHPRSWYLPHFGIVNPNKPEKLRLVFDAAAKTDGVSLNDNLLTGPDLVNSLIGVLIRFRQGRIAIKGDIREMFMQIKVRDEDQESQKFLWRGMERDREPDTYVMTSMIFGSASSPYTAQYVMQQNALAFKHSHPLADNAITRKHYVDDYLDSFDTIEEATERIKEVSHIQRKGGFEIKGWTSNDKLIFESFPKDERANGNVDLVINEIPMERTLGLKWCPSTDTFSFDLGMKKLPQRLLKGERKPTKREMLRIIMSVYDPLRILLPFVIRSKILLQDVWRSGIGWDDELNDREFDCWQIWINMLDKIKEYKIPRPYCGNMNIPSQAELHVFSDGSEKAYAAVAYLRVVYDDRTILVSFVAGKARVAPLKPVSIPRMELQGALIASRLAKTIGEELQIRLCKQTLWTDSQTVLGWIRADPRRYQSFVAHRLGEIDELTNSQDWKWIPTKLNPSDHATKCTGIIDKLMNQWIDGPEFLKYAESSWPKQPDVDTIIPPRNEAKREFTGTLIERPIYEAPKIENFSKWTSLLRSTALILLAPRIWRGIAENVISVEWMDKAESHLIRKVQQECFADEIESIKKIKH